MFLVSAGLITIPVLELRSYGRKALQVIPRRDLFIPDRWRSPTTFDFGSRELTIPKRSRSQNCQAANLSQLFFAKQKSQQLETQPEFQMPDISIALPNFPPDFPENFNRSSFKPSASVI